MGSQQSAILSFDCQLPIADFSLIYQIRRDYGLDIFDSGRFV